ncbi:uncharacterized protein LOC131946449 [Physella acuta]|uniref:uncharacterized protein LOC131946449 n=1 Tax=Physella acuta TaxID=109671 RepID=UPI0027DE4D32|nr:uncharacterized protein LOC131946449 [Physella acuta]
MPTNANGTTFSAVNSTLTSVTKADVTKEVVTYTDVLLVSATVVLVVNTAVSLFLNILLVLIIQYSPSLRTPPNSHLLNICVNNLLLCADMVLCALCLHYNSLQLPADKAEVISGVQIFITYNSLLQYWGTFASIGYYRHKTIKKPGLTLRSRRQLVSRSVTCNWVISSLLSLTVSLSYSSDSQNAFGTLDPFRRDFYANKVKDAPTREHVAVTFVILMAFFVGLGIILSAYYTICRTLNVVSAVGRNRVAPHQQSPHIHSDSTDLTLAVSRSYRPQYTIRTPSYLGSTLTKEHKDKFIVVFNKQDNTVSLDDTNIEIKQPKSLITNTPRNLPSRSAYGERRQLSTTFSNASTSSIKSRAPEFTDISIGADLLRFQREHSHTLHRRQSFRRESISLSSAIRNSLAMLIAYCSCSLPLIVLSVPEPSWALTPLQRLHALLGCRLLFYLNAPVYPVWYLLCSVTVRKCFTRLWESLFGRSRCRQ